MPSDHTRIAILSAAERLYADRGFADVTLRDIVAAADVNLAAVNYHFGSKDELIAELFVTRSLATNRERLNELKAAEEAGGGRANIDAILRALVGPTLRGCLGPDRGALHDPGIDRIGAADPAHQEPRDRPSSQICRRDAAFPARPRRGRALLGPALCARDGAPHHPRKRAAGEIVRRELRPQRRSGDHRAGGRGGGDGAEPHHIERQGHARGHRLSPSVNP